MSIKKELYEGSAFLGRTFAIIGLIITSLISLIFIIGGIYIVQSNSHLKSVDGSTTKDPICKTADGTTSCQNFVTYTVNGVTYKDVEADSSNQYPSGTSVIVYYSPNSPNKPQIDKVPSALGWCLIVFSIIIVIFSIIWVIITQRSKGVAAIGGAIDTLGMTRNIFS